MALLEEMGYVAYGVRDLDRAVEFYRNVCQLEVSERAGDTVFLTGNTRHHWVRLERRAEPGLIRLGYRASSPEALEDISSRLKAAGVTIEPEASRPEDRVTHGLRFRAPDGIEYEIYDQMLTLPVSPAPARGIACLLHAVVFVDDLDVATDFYTSTLDFLVSDRIQGVISFLRCNNQYHHSLALAAGGPAGNLDHIAMLVDDLEDVLRFRAHADNKGALAGDVVKHVASNSVSIYINEPTEGIGVEYCNGHDKIADEAYRGRLIKPSPTTVNAFSAGFPDRAEVGPPEVVGAGKGGGTAAASLAGADR